MSPVNDPDPLEEVEAYSVTGFEVVALEMALAGATALDIELTGAIALEMAAGVM